MKLRIRCLSNGKRLGPSVLVAAILLTVSASATAQPVGDQVPVPGVTTTLRLEGAIDKVDGPTHTAIVKTSDGVRHLLHFGRDTVVHGADSVDEGFGELQEGHRVLVHYVVKGDRNMALEIDRIGDGGLTVVEGAVQRIDQVGRRLTIQLADGSVLRLRLSHRAARDAARNIRHAGRVIVYYADDGDERVAHYFKQVR
jgi:phosphotransferase system IIA component